MNLSNLRRRLETAEKSDEGFHYLTPAECEAAIARAEAGLDPGVERWLIDATITHKISELHTTENHGADVWWQQCGRCQKRLYR